MTRQGFSDRSMFRPEDGDHPFAPRDDRRAMVPIRVVVDQLRATSVLVHAENDDPDNAHWLPLSLVEVEPGLLAFSQRESGWATGRRVDKAVPIKLPRWKLEEIGLAAFITKGQGRLF